MLSHIPFISREHYPAFRRLSREHPDFPASYDEWLHRRLEYRASEQGRGHSVEDIEIEPSEFGAWCQGRLVTRLALLNFAAHKAGQRKS